MLNKTIYIIDDDPIVRFIIEKMMSKMDRTLIFIHCENGKVGLEKLNGHQGEFSKCIILLDLNMPMLDGWGFLDEIQSRQLNDYKNVALYILSSSTDKPDIERSKKYSIVKKFYHKPLSIADITEILDMHIKPAV
ncbi:response regulator [Flavobacterium acetivorans]|uniref:response regulator n=1 Tax=Flavobacterium acetivorans TaxID=2893883 RepID=UPI001E386131|nr:response regulator [Flavobacterium sp. F-29]UFH34672.1 response regulator [Flavobacterium sp. F-29]